MSMLYKARLPRNNDFEQPEESSDFTVGSGYGKVEVSTLQLLALVVALNLRCCKKKDKKERPISSQVQANEGGQAEKTKRNRGKKRKARICHTANNSPADDKHHEGGEDDDNLQPLQEERLNEPPGEAALSGLNDRHVYRWYTRGLDRMK